MSTFKILAKQICEISRVFYQRGWCLATSGNFSARLEGDKILVTASGKDKGTLNENDFVLIDLKDQSSEASDASAETEIHCEIYRARPDVNAILHVHSPFATVLSMLGKEKTVLEGYEMLKALHGVRTHEHREIVPVFPNSQKVSEIASMAQKYLTDHPYTAAFLLSGHGLYTWGQDLQEAMRHVEAFEFLFECEYRRHIIKL